MPYYRRLGEVPRKRHTQFRQPDGSLYAEELVGQEGFSSDSSLLYHRYAPTAIVADQSYLESYPASHSQPVNWWSYWWSDFGGPAGNWRFDNTYGVMDEGKAN